jgi:replicative DNA helicase
MASEEVTDRAVSNRGRIDFGRLLSGKLSDSDWGRATEMLDEIGALPVWVDDQPALSIADIRHKVRMVPGIKVVVLDYLQLCSRSGTSSASNRNSEIEEISRGLKALAMELGLCVIALSQLNREVEKRPGKRPVLADLRDSGSIEQDADGIFFLWPLRDLEGEGRLIGLDVAKNRQGRPGVEIALDFRGQQQRWVESTEPIRTETYRQQPARGFHDDE